MKLNGIAGTGTGKLGSQVYASVKGEQVVRQYQSKVSNPSTTKQVAQRGRMKLMSQLAAAMGSVIAIPRQGLKSSRNLFSKKNFKFVHSVEGQAFAFLENFQLTDGNTSLGRVGMRRGENNVLSLFLQNENEGRWDRIIYNLFARNEEGELMLINSIVATDPGEDDDFWTDVEDYEGDLYLYAYGMRDKNASAKAKYGNYHVESGEDIAKLFMTRTLTAEDYEVSQTSGNSITIDDSGTVTVGENQVLVRFTILGDGAIRNNSASGAVITSPLVRNRGTQLKWYGVPRPPYSFNEWLFYKSDETITTSRNNPITFTVWEDINVVLNTITPDAD